MLLENVKGTLIIICCRPRVSWSFFRGFGFETRITANGSRSLAPQSNQRRSFGREWGPEEVASRRALS